MEGDTQTRFFHIPPRVDVDYPYSLEESLLKIGGDMISENSMKQCLETPYYFIRDPSVTPSLCSTAREKLERKEGIYVRCDEWDEKESKKNKTMEENDQTKKKTAEDMTMYNKE